MMELEIFFACEFINQHNFDAIFMSQIINFDQGGIAWAALRKKLKYI